MIVLRVPGTLDYRNLALRAVSEACKIALAEWGLGPNPNDPAAAAAAKPIAMDLEAELVSAVGEAINNVAIHAYADAPGDMSLQIAWVADEIVVQITDEGRSFDPQSVDLPDLDALPEGGMGLFIMRSFMDDVAYEPGPPNVLRMIKRRKGHDEGEVAPLSTRVVSPLPPKPLRSGSSTPPKPSARLADADPRVPASMGSGVRRLAGAEEDLGEAISGSSRRK